jgi:serpin B
MHTFLIIYVYDLKPMQFKQIILFLCGIFLFVFCNEDKNQQLIPTEYKIPRLEQILVEQSNELGFEGFRNWANSKNMDENLLISPLGLSFAVGSLFEASGFYAKSNVKRFLNISHIDDSLIRPGYDHLDEIYTGIDKTVSLSNLTTFAFNSEVFDVEEFSGLHLKSKYIQSVNDAAAGFLPDYVNSHPGITANGFQLLNSLSFQACPKYLKKLEESPFYFNPRSSGFVEMLVTEGLFSFFGDANLKAVEFPLGKGNYQMLVIIPNESQSINEIAAKMGTKLIRKIRSGFRHEYIELFLPSLHLSSIEPCNDLLKNKALFKSYNQNLADFSGISKTCRLFLSDFEQHIDLKLGEISENETSITKNPDAGLSQDMITVMVDRPYLFIIYEKYSDGILFIGRITHP